MTMKRDHNSWRWGVIAVVALSVILLTAACGKKADPVPPSATPPAPVDDLKADLDGSRVHLTWTQPSSAAAISVYRSRVSLETPACPGCPMIFERVAGTAALQGPTYSTELEKGYRYHFKVQVRDAFGQTADSNLVEVVF
jgi:hypothetical protein